MPSFDVTTDEANDGSLEFEVFCDCGAGLCNQSTVERSSYRRGMHQVVVTVCETCLAKKTDAINEAKAELEQKIEELENQIEELENQILELQNNQKGETHDDNGQGSNETNSPAV